MNMKNFIVICCLMLLILVFANGVNASNVNNIIETEFLDSSQEKQAVLDAMNAELPNIQIDFAKNFKDWGLTNSKEIPVTFGDPYKVYPVNPSFVEVFQREKVFDNCFSKDFMWEVPLISEKGKVLNTAHVKFFEGKWQPVLIGRAISPVDIKFSFDKNQIINKIEGKNIKGVKTVKHLRTGIPKMDMIYINSDSGEFMLPMSPRPDKLNKVKMGEVYSVNDLLNLIKDDFTSPKLHPFNR